MKEDTSPEPHDHPGKWCDISEFVRSQVSDLLKRTRKDAIVEASGREQASTPAVGFQFPTFRSLHPTVWQERQFSPRRQQLDRRTSARPVQDRRLGPQERRILNSRKAEDPR